MIIIENIDHICLAVSDIEKSIEFYRDYFGFDIIEHLNGTPEAILQVGDIRVRLISENEKNKSGGYVAFYVDEEDFEDALEEIEENSIEIATETEEYRGGKRVVIIDPSGNRIALCYAKK
jgi:metallothiol transferase